MDRIRVKIVLTIDWIEQHTKQLEALLRQGTEESKSTLNILRKRYAECLLEVLLAIDTFRQVQREMKRTEVVAEEILPSYSTVRVVHILVTFMHKETTSLTIVWAYNIREHLAQLRRVSEQLPKYEKSQQGKPGYTREEMILRLREKEKWRQFSNHVNYVKIGQQMRHLSNHQSEVIRKYQNRASQKQRTGQQRLKNISYEKGTVSYDKGTASYDKGTVSYNKGTGLRNNMKKYNYMDMFELQMKMKKERVNRTLDFGENDVIKNTGLSQRSQYGRHQRNQPSQGRMEVRQEFLIKQPESVKQLNDRLTGKTQQSPYSKHFPLRLQTEPQKQKNSGHWPQQQFLSDSSRSNPEQQNNQLPKETINANQNDSLSGSHKDSLQDSLEEMKLLQQTGSFNLEALGMQEPINLHDFSFGD